MPQEMSDLVNGILSGIISNSLMDGIKSVYKKYKATWQKNTESLNSYTADKLRNIPPKDIIEPDMPLALSILQSNAIIDNEQLRKYFANLLAASMNRNTHDMAHISFLNVLHNLSSQEALLLKTVPLLQEDMPIARICYQSKYDNALKVLTKNKEQALQKPIVGNDLCFSFTSGSVLFEHYMPLKVNLTPATLAFLLDNLVRLNLINIEYGVSLEAEGSYAAFTHTQLLDDILQGLKDTKQDNDDFHLVYNPGVTSPSMYGKSFYEICIK